MGAYGSPYEYGTSAYAEWYYNAYPTIKGGLTPWAAPPGYWAGVPYIDDTGAEALFVDPYAGVTQYTYPFYSSVDNIGVKTEPVQGVVTQPFDPILDPMDPISLAPTTAPAMVDWPEPAPAAPAAAGLGSGLGCLVGLLLLPFNLVRLILR